MIHIVEYLDMQIERFKSKAEKAEFEEKYRYNSIVSELEEIRFKITRGDISLTECKHSFKTKYKERSVSEISISSEPPVEEYLGEFCVYCGYMRR